jgi:hypothetical protein
MAITSDSSDTAPPGRSDDAPATDAPRTSPNTSPCARRNVVMPATDATAVTLPAQERSSNVVMTIWIGTRALPMTSGISESRGPTSGLRPAPDARLAPRSPQQAGVVARWVSRPASRPGPP